MQPMLACHHEHFCCELPGSSRPTKDKQDLAQGVRLLLCTLFWWKLRALFRTAVWPHMHAHACPLGSFTALASPAGNETILDPSQHLILTCRGFGGAAIVLHM